MLKKSFFLIYNFFYRQFDTVNQLRDNKILVNETGEYIKVHTATRWTIRHSLTLLWFADLMNVTEEVTIHRPKVPKFIAKKSPGEC